MPQDPLVPLDPRATLAPKDRKVILAPKASKVSLATQDRKAHKGTLDLLAALVRRAQASHSKAQWPRLVICRPVAIPQVMLISCKQMVISMYGMVLLGTM